VQPKKLSLKPGVYPAGSPEEATSWVENRNGLDSETKASAQDIVGGKVKRITFQVSETRHQAIKIWATKKGMTITELMLSLLDKELEQSM
jgi:predicted DNA binding CopG/RHH family protein